MTNKLSAALLLLVLFVGGGVFVYVWAGQKADFAPLGSLQHSHSQLFAPPQPIRVLFVGDIMLDRDVATAARTYGPAYLFSSTTQLFAEADARVANLEGTITDNPSLAQVDHTVLHFTFDPTMSQRILEPLNLSAVSLANNHSYDWGSAGYLATRDYLAQWGVPSFGHPYNNASYLSDTLHIGGKNICLVGYMELYNASTTNVTNEIKSLRPDCWRTIVFAHWGVEYSHTPTSAQVAEAHAFIDAGADMVVGAHPHVVESAETYKGKEIIYSLGNFMFDQNFSWDTEHGLAVYADLYDAKTVITFVPVTVQDEHTSVSTGQDMLRVLGFVGGVDTLTLP